MTSLSLEQLRKQAKELLKSHRRGDTAARARLTLPTPQLADAQHTLALEHGFRSWAALVAHCQRHPPGLARFTAVAETLARAYATGDFTAIRELNWEYGTGFAWERDLDRMQQWLPQWYAAAERTPALALADARHLVARQSGFEDWDALLASLRPPRRRPPALQLPFARFDPTHNRIVVHGVLAETHWDAIVALIQETGATGLQAGNLTDAALARVATLEQLTYLNADGAGQLTDDGLRHLARLPRLESLDLSSPRSRLTDRGIAILGALPALRELALCWAPQLTDTGLASLVACAHLEKVNLMGTPTGDGVLRALAGKTALQDLITGRQVTDAGLPLLHAIPAFRARPPGDGEVRLLLDGPVTDTGMHTLAGLAGLSRLGFFWHTPALTSAGLAALAALPNLRALDCEGSLCDDVGMAHIAAIPNLLDLNAQGTVATDRGFRALSRSNTLESLWGRECPNLTGPGFAALAHLPRLKKLAVSCKQVDDGALATLPGFPSLRAFTSIDVSDQGFRHIGACTGLEELMCMYCRDTTDAATAHLTALPRLQKYYAGMTRITDTSLALLARLRTLEQIEFWQVAGITDAGVAALGALPRLKNLTIHGSARVSRAVAAHFPSRVTVEISG